MAETAQAWSGSERPVVPLTWDTAEVGAHEAFDYYREGICQAFMPLRPSLRPSSRADFTSRVASYRAADTTLNVVSARPHMVSRGRREIAASPEPCFYLNLQVRGECHISQAGRMVTLRPGDVGIFDSDAAFDLDHGNRDALRVASIMVPHNHLRDETGLALPRTPLFLSGHPVYGRLLAEAIRTHSENAALTSFAETTRQRRLILSLVGMAMSSPDMAADFPGRPAAQLHRIRTIVRARCRERGFDVAACAAEAGVSPRYVHKLFRQDDDRFGAFLLRERLRVAAGLLHDPVHAHRAVADIALASGFADVSHFSRVFREAFSMSPGQWRATPFGAGAHGPQ